jgi:hypothetical protein
MHPHPQHQTHAPAQVMGVPARGHRVPLAQRLLCRPRALRLLVCQRRPCRYRSKPDRAAHPMSYLAAHPTTPLDSPLVHESQSSRSEAVRFVTHSHVCDTRRWQQQDSNRSRVTLRPTHARVHILTRRTDACCDVSTRCQTTHVVKLRARQTGGRGGRCRKADAG